MRLHYSFQLKSDVSLMEQGLHLPYDTSWEYPRDKLEFIKVLGSGAFGQVWLARAMHLSRHSKRDYENNITIKKYRKLSFYDYVKKTSKNNNKGSGIVYVAVKTLKGRSHFRNMKIHIFSTTSGLFLSFLCASVSLVPFTLFIL